MQIWKLKHFVLGEKFEVAKYEYLRMFAGQANEQRWNIKAEKPEPTLLLLDRIDSKNKKIDDN